MNNFANWEITGNNGIYVNGAPAYEFLVIGIALLGIAFLLIAIFAYYLRSFNKHEVQVKMMNKPLINITFVLPSIALILGIVLLLFWSIPQTIFGADGANNLFISYLSVAIVGFVILVFNIVTMWIWLPKFAIGLTKEQILFVGDYIPYSKITRIIKDSKHVYVNYTVGKRTLKKQAFALSSIFGQFILVNIEAFSGHHVEEGSQAAYVENYATNEEFASIPVAPQPVIAPRPKSTTAKKAVAKKPAAKKSTTAKKPATKKKTTTKSPVKSIKKVSDTQTVIVVEGIDVKVTTRKVKADEDKKKK